MDTICLPPRTEATRAGISLALTKAQQRHAEALRLLALAIWTRRGTMDLERTPEMAPVVHRAGRALAESTELEELFGLAQDTRALPYDLNGPEVDALRSEAAATVQMIELDAAVTELEMKWGCAR